MMAAAKNLFSYKRFWAHRLGPAPFLPMTRGEMDALGWDSCDIIVVTGDAYIDHPSFGMAIIGRLWEAQGFRVGIIAQPDWQSAEPFRALCARWGEDPAVVAHRYALSLPNIDTVVLGVKNRTELAQCLAAEAAGALDPVQMGEIDALGLRAA